MGGDAPTILIVSTADDPHALAVQKALDGAFRKRSVILDLAAIPAEPSRFGAGDGSTKAEMGSLDLSAIEAIWWRRPNPCLLPANQMNREHVQVEWDQYVEGLLHSRGCRWVNEPFTQRRAALKLVQLGVAARLGFLLPETLTTTCPDRARAFLETHQCAVYKRVGTGPGGAYTRLVTPSLVDRLDALRSCPVTFQKYIEPGHDLRVTWIGGRSFAMKIDTAQSGTPEDSRRDYTVEHAMIELDPILEARLSKLMGELGLVYGAIDLRVSKNGDTYLLEVNPAGQFAFVEILTDMPVIEAMARLLAEGPLPA